MTCLPMRFCTGSCALRSERCMRSSCWRLSTSSFSSRTRWRLSFSRAFSAASTSSLGMCETCARSSSSLVSTLVSIWSVRKFSSTSPKTRPNTSFTLALSSASVWSWASTPVDLVPLSVRALALSSSPAMSRLRAPIWARRPAVSSSLARLVCANLCLRSSRFSSVSCEFWMRKRLLSSSVAKISSSCPGSVKYMGSSSPESST
mmetsp:Transcript_316/g.862  ORF Transcript_316/g.862 Transcript_316/m.862 type:complete len:204 (+) Transcript_316:153-764(+)